MGKPSYEELKKLAYQKPEAVNYDDSAEADGQPARPVNKPATVQPDDESVTTKPSFEYLQAQARLENAAQSGSKAQTGYQKYQDNVNFSLSSGLKPSFDDLQGLVRENPEYKIRDLQDRLYNHYNSWNLEFGSDRWRSQDEIERFRTDYDNQRREILSRISELYADYGSDAELSEQLTNLYAEISKDNSGTIKELADFYGNWDSEDSYKTWQQDMAYRQKYAGKSYTELECLIEGIDANTSAEIAELERQKTELAERAAELWEIGTPEALEERKSVNSQWGKLYKQVKEMRESASKGTPDISEEELAWLKAYAPEAMTLREAQVKMVSSTGDENLFYTNLYNSKLMDEKMQILSEVSMPGENRTVLEALQYIVANNGKVSDSYKNTVMAEMKKAGVDPDEWYSLMTGDSNFSAGNFLDWLGASAISGLGSFNKSITGTLDYLVGKPLQALGWKNNPVSSVSDYYSDAYNAQAFNRNLYKEKMGGGKAYDIAGSIIEGTVAAVPDAVLAFMTAGSSAGATSSRLATNAAYMSGNFLTKAGITVQNMARNPSFWLSYGRTYSGDYEQAKSMGASDTTAALCATITSLINSGIEVGFSGTSGIQGLPEELMGDGNKLLAWLVSAAEEGGEEVLQGFVNNLVAKVAYAPDTQLANLKEMAEEFGMGASVGLLLGGGESVFSSAVNAYSNHQQNKRVKQIYGSSVEELIAEGLESDHDSLSYLLAVQFQQRVNSGKELSGAEIVQLVQADEDAIRAEYAAAAAEEQGKRIQSEESREDTPTESSPQTQNDTQQKSITGQEAFQAEIARQMGIENVSEPDTSRGESIDRGAVEHAFAAGEIDFDTYNQIMDEIDRMESETEGRAYARATKEVQSKTVKEVTGEAVSRIGNKFNFTNKNGGTVNANSNERTQTPTVTQPGTVTGNGVSDGGQGRYADPGTAEQAGSLGSRAAGKRPAAYSGTVASVQRQNAANDLRRQGIIQNVSSKELGLQNGTDAQNLLVIPESHWDAELQLTAKQIYEETGCTVTYVIGGIEVARSDGRVGYARGVFQSDKIILQADNKVSVEQLGDHEIFHWKSNELRSMVDFLAESIMEQHSMEEFSRVLDTYKDNLWAIYGCQENASADEYEETFRRCVEEVLADAYAGINAFGAGADRFTEGVRGWMDENGVGRLQMQENGTEQPTGPPVERFSTERPGVYSGEAIAFAEDIRSWNRFGQSTDVPTFILGSTGSVIQALGGIESDIYLTPEKAKKILHDHPEVSIDILADIPKILEDPILILTSKGINSRLILYGSVLAENRRPVLVVFDMHPVEKGFYINDMQKVNSVYTKTETRNRNADENGRFFLESSDVLYADKKRTTRLLSAIGLSAPITCTQGGYIGSISYEGSNVKTEGVPFMDIFEYGDKSVYDTYLAKETFSFDDSYQDADEAQIAGEVEEMRGRAEPKAEPLEAEEVTPIARENLPAKARDTLTSKEWKAFQALRNTFGVPYAEARDFLRGTVQQLSDAYLETGKISQEIADQLFEDAWRKGEIEDREFYDQYKDIKDKLRTTAVTLDARDQGDIVDFLDFKKRSRWTLRIVNEGGIPVDTFYDELRGMAPELFPEEITHPADQLVKMYEVANSIVKQKQSLDEYYGVAAGTMKQAARESFDSVIDELRNDLWKVRRFGEDKAAQAEKKAQMPKVRTVEEALEAGNKMKNARRNSERAVRRNLLTAADEEIVGKLLRGEMSLEQLDPSKDNVEGIREVYEAKKEYEEARKSITEYKRQVHAALFEKADSYLETANEWKDKAMGIQYSRETMTRNVYDIVPDKVIAKQVLSAYFEPVQIAEAARTRFKTEMRNRVADMNLSRKVAKGNVVSEAHAVQLLGEAQDNIESLKQTQGYIKTRDGKTLEEWQAVILDLWGSNPNLDKAKIQRSVEQFRQIYDELFTMMNEVRVRFGYEPVSYRKGYFPHFQPDGGDGIMAYFGKVLGIDTQVDVLPTTINGLTHTFKPGTTWFGNAQERLGFNTVYDAVEGFDRYIEGVSDVIFHTENIQNLRALATQIRYRTSEEGIQKQVDNIRTREDLSDTEKEDLIKSTLEKGKYSLSNFVNELDEYTNLLANKKSRLDRGVEALFGRNRFYRLAKNLNSRVGANMVVGNVSSAMTNFIPLVQAAGRVGDRNMLRAMWDTLRNADDGIVGKSDFLTSRRGSDVLVKTKIQKASELAGILMNIVDNFSSDTLLRAAYYKNLQSGMSETEALHEADIFAAGVMAGRAKGDMPTLFHSVNPIIKMFTQFQLEVNNQYSEVFKDMPRHYRGQAAFKIAMSFLSYFVRAYLFNDLFELLFGRRPALDPISLINDFVGDTTGYKIPSLSSIVSGNVSFETNKKGAGEAVKNIAKSSLGELPFSAALTLFGIETDGGRIPVSSAIPDLSVLVDVLTNDDWDGRYKWKKVQDELNKLAYVIPPFGGGQISKTWKGLKAFSEGGSYTVDKNGQDILQYPIYKESPIEALGNALRTAVMGKNSVPEAVQWVESGFDSLGAKQTAMYKDMLDAGVKARDAYELIDALRSAEKTKDKAKKDVQLDIIRSSNISDEGKTIAVYGILESETLEKVMDILDDEGVDAGTILDVVYGYRAAELLERGEKAAKRKVILDADLTENEKLLLVGELMGTDMETSSGKPTEYAKLLDAMQEGMTVDEYLTMVQANGDLDDYLEYTEAGLSKDEALYLVDALEDLEPEPGNDKVTDIQKWQTCVDFSTNEAIQLSALRGAMDEKQYAKVELAYDFGVTPRNYIKLQEIKSDYDADGNGSYSNKEIQTAIDSMSGMTMEQKAVLWQIATGSTSAKNNPYSKQVGQQVLDAKNG
ncbi:MAG: hypothetical protein ACI3W5_09425 [Faecousia sp.]